MNVKEDLFIKRKLMRNNIEYYKELLNKCLERAYEVWPIPDEYKIPEDEWFILFDIMEAHFLAHNIINRFEEEMDTLVYGIIFFQHTYLNENHANLFCSLIHDYTDFCQRQQFYSIECEAIRDEINEKVKKYNK